MAANNEPKIGGILLAAGGSSRLGHPKQLVQFQGKTLIRRAAETLTDSSLDLSVIVLGAEIENSTIELAGLPVSIATNKEWQSGMSSSIKTGLNKLLELEPNLSAVLIALCDQPHVTAADVDSFCTLYKKEQPPVIAAKYDDIFGVPALFSSTMFRMLQELSGDEGARNIIKSQKLPAAIILDGAAVDIDTTEDILKHARIASPSICKNEQD